MPFALSLSLSEGVKPRHSPGPSTVDPTLTAIVASRETAKGAAAVNKRRNEKVVDLQRRRLWGQSVQSQGLSTLRCHIIDLAEESAGNFPHLEAKVSSSNARVRLLGTQLRPPRPRVGQNFLSVVIGIIGFESGCRRVDRVPM